MHLATTQATQAGLMWFVEISEVNLVQRIAEASRHRRSSAMAYQEVPAFALNSDTLSPPVVRSPSVENMTVSCVTC